MTNSPAKKRNIIPGEYILREHDVEINKGKENIRLEVINHGDRPVQVGSHFHFFEVNKQLSFDRKKALGMHLNIASGTAIRFEPGEKKVVYVTSFGGRKTITGFHNVVNDSLADIAQNPEREKHILQTLSDKGFLNSTEK